MPTPVTVARQCLTPDAAHALDEAVSVARRRGHAQTTSLHAVSALLSLPSSSLREACARARNCAYSPRLQFKALELCLSVSLDRVSSSQLTDDPPVSNSLMAAIKRSQANQRRQPENFHLYNQLPQHSSSSSSSSVTVVKVELQHLILSILDDPVVSRVFSEAGFRSSEIKLAIVRPLHSHLYKFPRSRAPPPPIFLCNYPGENTDPVAGRRGLGSFTFPGFGGFLAGDDESRRIGEVLVKRRKNPLLLGVCANAALNSFRESVEENNKNNDNIKKTSSVLPVELSGLDMVSIQNDVSRFITENGDEKSLSVRFEEVGMLIEQSLGAGVVVNYGDLKVFVDGGDDNSNSNNSNNDNENGGGKSDAVSHVVAHLTRLVQLYGVKIWLIGAAATYETYSKFLSRFPSIDKDWNLELLPITSLRPSSMAGPFPKSSLMESFVPFGGFFSTPSDLKSPLNSLYQGGSRCNQCNEKCEQEIAAFSKGGSNASIADQCQSSLPPWLQMAESGTNKGLDLEAKDDRRVLSTKVAGVQKKWDDICQSLHHNRPFPNPSIYQVGSQFPTVMGFRFLDDKKENANNSSISTTNAPPNENSCVNVNSGIPIDLENTSASNSVLPFPIDSKSKNESFLSKLLEKPLKAGAESGGLRSACSLSNSSVGDGSQASPTSVTSVTTDLGLGLCSAPTSSDLKKRLDEDHAELSPEVSGCFSANVDIVNEHLPAQSSSSSCPDLHRHFDLSNFKMLFSALSERVGWQDEAIGMISQTIATHRKGNENRHGASARADIWFNFVGPDKSGKRKIAIALAEILYGSKENLICADISSQDGMINAYPIFSHQDASDYSMEFRGKTVVDYVAGELSKKPLSIVFLENVDKADVQVRSSLSKAIQTGKFSDSYGREVSISNAIFVTTSSMKGSKIISSGTYSEESILRAKSQPIQFQVEPALGNSTSSLITMRKDLSHPILFNKRKLIGRNPEQHDVSEMVKRAHTSPTRNLDLNLPAEGEEVKDTDDGNSDNDSSESSKSWLQDFYDHVVETVVFMQFDFDALAKKISKDINEIFHRKVGSECLLEIDSKVMEQLLAAAYLSNRNRVVEDWLENVLSREFIEVRKRYNLTSHSIVKLITCSDNFPGEPTPVGVCLPPKVVVN
ncbi:hypothetical protein Ddye_030236 [Dipteronia dyeriana]|uniref:Clp R domain-containing protein n=1 Tax=Dipteronia dyeriana TaxID=168575 RepID=A0AAD9WLB0_9ROSI|nr:hypothetical protein Ddye_030236 [Dipteronia dyeriana]